MTTETPAAPLPIDLEQLDDGMLQRLRTKADDILEARCEAALPAHVLDDVRAALADDTDAAPPVSVEFTTREYDNGHYWNETAAKVTLADGSTREVDLRRTVADDTLTDHASWAEPYDDSTLTVTFEPLAFHVEY
ncbi:hypothetical protein SEA_GILGAMESH_132 [Streptomyces phage Gilgamesh]|uniref:Uncharacterized protein n=1 Tax=Streptomyces phage Gilgamesh TaxID=2599890 RepID=A0A5J6TTE6_9CAUD|nr:hypothetical protein QEH35_gp132 [Streptomyces phage Gilgamesh]QFG13324.1 hypothetical protein SEA_GILGAMESH_132 [Streptomyces phage Gilgamesh]